MAKNDDDKEFYNKVFGTVGIEWDWGQLITNKDENFSANDSDLYETYRGWSKETDHQYQMSQHIFSSRLQERGFRKNRTNKWTLYLGLTFTCGIS